MKRAFLISIACIALVAFVGSCGQEARREDPVRQDMPEKFKKVQSEKRAAPKKKKAKHKQIKGRKRYEAFANTRIRDAESRLEDMKSRTMHSSGRSRRASERNVRELQRQIHEAHVNLDKLEKANNKNWEQSKQTMEKTLAKISRYSE